jgi:predicted  nucleic acid-binding Zn-ribbon protein
MNATLYIPSKNGYSTLGAIDARPNLQNASAKVAEVSGAIATVAATLAATTGPGAAIAVPVAAVASAVAGIAALVSRISKDNEKIALEAAAGQTEKSNAQLRLQILMLDAENSKLQNVINQNNKDLSQFSGLGFCLFNCDYKEAKASLKTANQQYQDLSKELEDKMQLSAQLASRALEVVEKLTGLKSEKKILIYVGSTVLALSIGYLIYKLV